MPPCRSRRSRTRPCTCTRWSRPTPTKCALLRRGAGREGAGHRRAFRLPLRDRPDEAQRRAVASPRAQAPRPGGNGIGRLKAKHSHVASHYQIVVTANEAGDQAVAVNWTRRPQDGSMVTHPGVYCLRSSETDWNEDALWRTYTTLTDVEAVFRSLKSELGTAPEVRPTTAGRRPGITYRLPARAGHPSAARCAARSQVDPRYARPRRPQRVTAPPPSRRTHVHVRTATQAERDGVPSSKFARRRTTSRAPSATAV